jgi:hypothetical protein
MDGLNGNRHQKRNGNKIIMAIWNVRSNIYDKEERKTQVEMVGGCA